MTETIYPPITRYKTADELLAYAKELGINLPFEAQVQARRKARWRSPIHCQTAE
jgi:hypothetical protein